MVYGRQQLLLSSSFAATRSQDEVPVEVQSVGEN